MPQSPKPLAARNAKRRKNRSRNAKRRVGAANSAWAERAPEPGRRPGCVALGQGVNRRHLRLHRPLVVNQMRIGLAEPGCESSHELAVRLRQHCEDFEPVISVGCSRLEHPKRRDLV